MVNEPAPPTGTEWDCTQHAVVQRLYARLGRAVLSRVQRIVRRDDIAQEILQETFTKLWDLGPVFATELAAFTWVYRTSQNLAIDHIRSGHARTELWSPDAFDMVSQAPKQADVEVRQLVTRLLGRLDKQELNVYLYKTVDGMTLDEIARFTEVSTKTVSRLLARIERKLDKKKVELYDEIQP